MGIKKINNTVFLIHLDRPALTRRQVEAGSSTDPSHQTEAWFQQSRSEHLLICGWKVYILLSKSVRKTYIGSTDNFQRRLTQHNEAKVTSTKNNRPWIPIVVEFYPTERDAREREKFLKTITGRRYLQKTINEIINKWIGSSTG